MQGLYFVTAPSMTVLLCRKHVSPGTYHDSYSAQDSIKAIPCNNNNKNKKNSNDNYKDDDDDTVGSGKFSRWLNSKNKITAINILAVSVQFPPLEWSAG